jgi:hypothetical protein
VRRTPSRSGGAMEESSTKKDDGFSGKAFGWGKNFTGIGYVFLVVFLNKCTRSAHGAQKNCYDLNLYIVQ